MEISAEQARGLARVAQGHGLRLVVAFGSGVTGRTHSGSDLDLAVLPAADAPVSLAALASLTADLSAVFAGVEVDVSVIPHADALLLKKIFETGALLYGDEREFRQYRVYAFRRYSEYLPYLRLEASATKRLVRQLRRAN